jgi:hypothetical protein
MPSTVRFNQRLPAWFLLLGNEDREAFLGGLKILELRCPLDAIAGREPHPFTDALRSDSNAAADFGSSDVHKDEPDKLRVFIADRTPASPSKFRCDDDAKREEAPVFFAERSR